MSTMCRLHPLVAVLFLVFIPEMLTAEFKVVQYWNGVANDNKKITLAVRANSEIKDCSWIHLDTEDEYREGKKKNGVEVSIEKYDKSNKKTLCKLEIDKVKDADHGGEWSVEIEGKCKERFSNVFRRRNRGAEFRTLEATERAGRGKRDTNSSFVGLISNVRPSLGASNPIESLSGRTQGDIQFTQSRRKNQRQRNRDCKIELEGIQLEVAEDDKELLLLPAMEGNGLEDVFTELDGAWGVPENKKTTLSTRTNQLPDYCLIIFEGEEVVTAEKKTKKNDEECEKFEGATVCVTKYEDRKSGTFACQLSIEDMNEDLVGNWEVEVEAGKESDSVDFDVDIDASTGDGDCEVEEGKPSLVNAKRDEITICTDDFEEGDEFTIEVEFESNPEPQKIEWEMRRKNRKQKKVVVQAGKSKTGFDAEDEEEDSEIEGRYIGAITFDLEEEDLDEDENFSLTVKNKKGTSEFLITLDSSSRCKPTQEEVGEGCSSSSYTCDLDDDKDCRCNRRKTECCDASRRCKENCCKKCSNDDKDDGVCDLCDKRKRKCMASEKNSESSSGTTCDPKDDKDCRCDEKGKGDNCCDASKRCKGKSCCKECDRDERKDKDVCNMCDDRGRDCMKLEGGGLDGGPYAKAVKVMLESCVKLGGTLLEQWTPEGKKRGSKNEKEFKNDLEDFFETAKCTRFDKDIQDYYDDGGKKKRRDRYSLLQAEDRQVSGTGSGTISFQSAPLRNKVAKVASSSATTENESSLLDILGFASDVVGLSKNDSG